MTDNSACRHYYRAWIHSGILRMNGWKSSRVKHTLHQFWLGLSHPFINLKIIPSHKNPAHCGFNIYVLCFLNTVCSYSVRGSSPLNVWLWSCWTQTMTRKVRTCVGIIASRMFLIVSMVSCGEVVLLFSLLLRLGPGVLDWLRVGCWSDSLPNITRAFSETWGTASIAFCRPDSRLLHKQCVITEL